MKSPVLTFYILCCLQMLSACASQLNGKKSGYFKSRTGFAHEATASNTWQSMVVRTLAECVQNCLTNEAPSYQYSLGKCGSMLYNKRNRTCFLIPCVEKKETRILTGQWMYAHRTDIIPKCAKNITSCSSWKSFGYSISGWYVVQPDPNQEAFLVFCDMMNEPVMTVINHDLEERVITDHCVEHNSPQCYSRNITYNITFEQVSLITQQSTSCKQFFRYECFGTPLLLDGVSAWYSANGQENSYFAGNSTTNSCACGITNTCAVDAAYATGFCNCDNNDNVWREDEGFLTDKNDLPVAVIKFGDLDSVTETAYHTLGPLLCYH